MKRLWDKVVTRQVPAKARKWKIGLNEASTTMVDKFGVHDNDGAADMLAGH